MNLFQCVYRAAIFLYEALCRSTTLHYEQMRKKFPRQHLGRGAVIVLFVALCGHSGVSHDSHSSLRYAEMQLVRRLGPFEYSDFAVFYVADSEIVLAFPLMLQSVIIKAPELFIVPELFLYPDADQTSGI